MERRKEFVPTKKCSQLALRFLFKTWTGAEKLKLFASQQINDISAVELYHNTSEDQPGRLNLCFRICIVFNNLLISCSKIRYIAPEKSMFKSEQKHLRGVFFINGTTLRRKSFILENLDKQTIFKFCSGTLTLDIRWNVWKNWT